jgi:hypothetical protein
MARAKIFKFFEGLENDLNKARFGSQPRNLTDSDMRDWDDAASRPRPTPPRNQAEVIAALKRINRYKYATYVNYRKWVRRKMKKLGLNPEDERYLL